MQPVTFVDVLHAQQRFALIWRAPRCTAIPP